MKKHILFLATIVLMSICAPSFAQSVEINSSQDITVDHTGFYPFSSSANSELMSLLNDGTTKFNVNITNFSGKPCRIAPAADNREIGGLQKVTGDSDHALNFKRAKRRNLAGLSFREGHGPAMLTVDITPIAKGNCPSPVSCATDCTSKFDKCCEADAMGNVKKVCNPTGVGNACGCIPR